MIRLLIVDDHDVVRMGLKQVFSGRVDMEVAGEARTGRKRSRSSRIALTTSPSSTFRFRHVGRRRAERAKAIRPEMAVLIVSGYPRTSTRSTC
jgi:DNA-binding NarL/FixJ family response regulator